jgi:hypothetical protein
MGKRSGSGLGKIGPRWEHGAPSDRSENQNKNGKAENRHQFYRTILSGYEQHRTVDPRLACLILPLRLSKAEKPQDDNYYDNEANNIDDLIHRVPFTALLKKQSRK